jgi:hypothetical protein
LFGDENIVVSFTNQKGGIARCGVKAVAVKQLKTSVKYAVNLLSRKSLLKYSGVVSAKPQ